MKKKIITLSLLASILISSSITTNSKEVLAKTNIENKQKNQKKFSRFSLDFKL